MIVQTELEPRTIGENIRDLREMLQSPGWKEHMVPLLRDLESEHTEAAIDPSRKKERRAEHIEAIHVLRRLATYPETRIKELEASWKQSQRKPQSA